MSVVLPTGAYCFSECRVPSSVFSLFRCRPERLRERGAAVIHEPVLAGHRSIHQPGSVELRSPGLTKEDLPRIRAFDGRVEIESQLSSLRYAERISRQAIRFLCCLLVWWSHIFLVICLKQINFPNEKFKKLEFQKEFSVSRCTNGCRMLCVPLLFLLRGLSRTWQSSSHSLADS